ncbi:BamA/TamA family outer membrane protein [Myxococcota bacterium]|nr:BamA/TamA family outer membrane protein [Myxococcota bacterium]MBU1429113.1 BamA/TamA family outer membrane protein [Myxococcota bacterium]MBU1898370.1 BamA/TamA family outer membrane protein [Myxococcota bacterium]
MRRLTLLTLMLLTAPAHAGDGDLIWRTISTPHFEVHFPLNLEAIAQRTARLCEEAHALLTPIHGYAPRGLTQVVVSDYGDAANGSATALPYKLIQVYAAPPTLDGNLNDYDDWLRLLIFHEFTHILQLDQIRGLPAFINRLFGRHLAPNHNLPSVVLEGGAVWIESLTSRRGRIRSALFRGFLRAAALADALHPVDAVVHSPMRWPGANVWYMYGGHFISWLVDTYGIDPLNRVYEGMSDELIPFSLNRAFEEATGLTFVALFEIWSAQLKRRAQAEAALIRRRGETPLSWLTHGGVFHESPRFGPDGALYAYEYDEDTPPGVYRRVAGEKPERILKGGGLGGFDLCGDQLLFSRAVGHQGAYSFHDLFIRPLGGGQERRLTVGARLREPACGPDGRWAAATQIINGRVRLVRASLRDGGLDVLFDPGGINQVGHPTVDPISGDIVFIHLAEGRRDLYRLRAGAEIPEPLTQDDDLELFPRFTADGAWLIFSADGGGVFDLYAIERATGRRHRLSRTISGALDAARAPQGHLVTRGLRADGYDLATLPFEPQPWRPEGEAEAGEAPPLARSRDVATAPALPHHGYSPSETLWPIAWSPGFSFSNASDVLNKLGLEAITSDAAGHHLINAVLSGAPEEASLTAQVGYTYLRPAAALSLALSYSDRTRENGALFGGALQPWRERLTTGALGVTLPLSRAVYGGSLSMRYQLADARPNDNVEAAHDPLDPAPYMPGQETLAALSVAASFSHTDNGMGAISIERGWRATTTLRLRDPRLGGTLESAELFLDLAGYAPLWARHVLAGRLSAGLGRGDSGQRVLYALSPAPRRNLLLDMLDDVYFGGGVLRGYPAGLVSGDRFTLLSAEYRLPLAQVFAGPSTVPLFLRSLKLAIFTDWGQADTAPLEISPDRFHRSAGVELLTEATFGWRKPWDSRVGWARGFDEGGEDQIYFFVGQWF